VTTNNIANSPIDQLQAAILFLADRCDGAREQDGRGFNGRDTRFGRSIAEQIRAGRSLSANQTMAAGRMLNTYKSQLAIGGLALPPTEELEQALKMPVVRQVAEGNDRRCEMSDNGQLVKIFFDYNPGLVAFVKEHIPDRAFVKGECGRPSYWNTNQAHAATVVDVLRPEGFSFSAEVLEAATEAVEATLRKQQVKRDLALVVAQQVTELSALAGVDQPFGPDYTLRDYQKEGVEFLLARTNKGLGKGAILADSMGLGKTAQMLFAARGMQLAFNCVVRVICPVSLMDNWQKEAEMVGVLIETYSWSKVPTPLEELNYVVIADEAHYAQNMTSQRTKRLLALAAAPKCLAVWLATGTPMKNGQAQNLLPLLRATNHELAKDEWGYKRRYCNAHQRSIKGRSVWDFSGCSNLQELSIKTADVMLQRKKSEVLTELPEKTRVMVPVHLEAAESKLFDRAMAETIANYQRRIEMADPEERERLKDAEAIVALTNARRISSAFKINHAIDMAEELLANGQQVVLFSEFAQTAKDIRQALAAHGAELLTGETKSSDRQALVDRFQSGESKVFVGTCKAGGVGITLTAASNLIMVDRPWTPGDAFQAEDRCHRMGQKNAAMIFWLQLSAVDYAIDELIQEKQARIELVLKGKRKTFRGLKSVQDIANAVLGLIQAS
jgi:SNF2 family DNA or RNA helicase